MYIIFISIEAINPLIFVDSKVSINDLFPDIFDPVAGRKSKKNEGREPSQEANSAKGRNQEGPSIQGKVKRSGNWTLTLI